MHLVVEMSEQDHFLATLFVAEATPTFLRPGALELLRSARMAGPGRSYRIEGDEEDVANLRWAMDRCVRLVEDDCSDAARCGSCDAFDTDYGTRLHAAARRLEDALDGARSDVDWDGSDEVSDDDMAACGPEYPRNDAGEWLGRM